MKSLKICLQIIQICGIIIHIFYQILLFINPLTSPLTLLFSLSVFNSFNIEQYIERSKQSIDPLYISGHYVKYRREGDYIYVNEPIE